MLNIELNNLGNFLEIAALGFKGIGVVTILALFIHWMIKGDTPAEKAAAMAPLDDFPSTDPHVLFQHGKFLEANLVSAGIDELELVNTMKREGHYDLTRIKAIFLDRRGAIVALMN